MAMVELTNKGILKHVISQNIDGLHRKSGVDAAHISEAHGNMNLEMCEKCGANYMRDFRVRTANKVHEHYTGRMCDNKACGGKLYDTIINYGESLNEEVINTAFMHGYASDLMVAMGTSLRVTPVCDIVSDMAQLPGTKTVIINL